MITVIVSLSLGAVLLAVIFPHTTTPREEMRECHVRDEYWTGYEK